MSYMWQARRASPLKSTEVFSVSRNESRVSQIIGERYDSLREILWFKIGEISKRDVTARAYLHNLDEQACLQDFASEDTRS